MKVVDFALKSNALETTEVDYWDLGVTRLCWPAMSRRQDLAQATQAGR